MQFFIQLQLSRGSSATAELLATSDSASTDVWRPGFPTVWDRLQEMCPQCHTQQTGWQKLLSRRSPPVERPSTKTTMAGTVIWHFQTISEKWKLTCLATEAHSDSFEFICAIQITLMYVCMYLWGKSAICRSFVVRAESKNTAVRADSKRTTNNNDSQTNTY